MNEKSSMPIIFKQFVVESTHPNFHLAHLKKALANQMCEVRELDIDEVIYRP